MTVIRQLGGYFFIDEQAYISPSGKMPTADEVQEELIRRKYSRMARSCGDPKINDFADEEIAARKLVEDDQGEDEQ